MTASERVMLCICVVFVLAGMVKGETIIDFEELSLASESYWNGADLSGGFSSGGAWFANDYNETYGSWKGFAYSNITDTAASDWGAQYNAITGSGEGGSANYAVGYVGWGGPPTMMLEMPSVIAGLSVTNNNYAYYSMMYGDMFAKQFGGASGDDADWFLLTITGKNELEEVTGTVDFYLADYRFADNGLDYIVDGWEYVDLGPLGEVSSVEFSLSSSDVGEYGMNTPVYFVIDSIVVPEPGMVLLMGLGVVALKRKR